ncbi:hypothetical protein RHMOL_Rhmol04G0173500 [Rhododendron molle]|uniref:Uncharacterized protein n=1 Tax=Rhododendron molle TaxID=49168 RepID=A0ACC0P307_RHOML|nr:hypothetical protein RHMOL_Rhmol04G0173500 [Rhododendron molle]
MGLPLMFIRPSNTLSSPKRRKALIADSDKDTISYPGTGRMTRSKQAMRKQEKTKEEEKEKQDAELDENAKISSFCKKRPSHRSSLAHPSDTSSSHQSPSQKVPLVEPINEENPNTMVDLNQVGNPENLPDFSNPETSTIENHVDSLLAVPETPLPESLETPTLQDATLDLNLNGSGSVHMTSSSFASFDVHAFSSKVKAFCDKICLPCSSTSNSAESCG